MHFRVHLLFVFRRGLTSCSLFRRLLGCRRGRSPVRFVGGRRRGLVMFLVMVMTSVMRLLRRGCRGAFRRSGGLGRGGRRLGVRRRCCRLAENEPANGEYNSYLGFLGRPLLGSGSRTEAQGDVVLTDEN